MTSTTELFRPRSTVERRLDANVRWCLLLSGVAAAGGMFGLLLVWGGMVAPGWAVSVVFLAAALIISVLRTFVRRKLDRFSGDALRRRRSGWWAAFAVVAVTCTGLLALGDIAFEATYKMLQPSGPGFCKAVVREDSVLFLGGGELYAVGFGGIGRSVSSWTTDDGYRPIRHGTYEFKWTEEGALLRVSGNGHDPVWPALHDFDCR